MKKKSEKQEAVEALKKLLAGTPHVFVSGFEKLTVQQDFELRKTVRRAGGEYRVVKNSLAERAAAGTPAEAVLRNVRGMTSLASTSSDPVALAKALTNYAKNNPSFTFKAGMVEGRAIDMKMIQELAALPSREEVLGKLLFLIQAPAQRLVAAVQGVGRNLTVVLDQAGKENKFRA